MVTWNMQQSTDTCISLNIILTDSHSTHEPIAMEDFLWVLSLGVEPSQVELFIFNWNERLDFSHQETEREREQTQLQLEKGKTLWSSVKYSLSQNETVIYGRDI